MKVACLLIFSLCLAAAAPAEEDASAAASATAQATKADELRLSGLLGFGFDSVAGASAGTGLLPGVAQTNALAIRYWINEKLCWDGLLAVNFSSQPQGAQGSPGTPAGTNQRAYGVGTQFKYNLARPTVWVLGQFLARASLAQFTQSDSNNTSNAQTTNTLSIGLGLGFEAFVPVWKALSVEGSVGLNFDSTQVKVEGNAQATQSGSSLSIDSNGLTPLNLAIHYYF